MDLEEINESDINSETAEKMADLSRKIRDLYKLRAHHYYMATQTTKQIIKREKELAKLYRCEK